ncbi:oligopeptide/dipeptide ABC transporter ATP-binding protein [Bosea sp. 117]|uniref:ABC transporter ATP-binding protein n=1 Tax=Bosea sp. 117 TaxID=1125973 RepID=UPI0004943CA7|nr:oligopeptide/dipeptide ABC transporter ATP-binding protein [Bosea sp. 117]
MAANDTILSVDRLTVRFDASAPLLKRLVTGAGRRIVHAVEEVDFEVARGSTFALVGESGCGKSTIARTIAGIQPPTAGSVSFMGVDIAGFRTRHAAMPYRRNLQMIFQDPYASLNPRWRIGRIVAEPILTHALMTPGAALKARVAELLETVGLSPGDAGKFPHQFSGGQRQRISIARALASNPAFIVCDEPTSALDVSVQAQILNLMKKLQRELGLTYLLISHNLAVVAHMADRLGVMYLGRLVEQGDAAQILGRPLHPYTRLLLDTVPDPRAPGRARPRLSGEVPSPLAPPAGCAFHPRCPLADARCARERPQPVRVGAALVACHAVEERRLPALTSEQECLSSPGDAA